MALPPPQRPRVVGGSIPLRTRMALSQLLDACGLPPHLSNALASATAGFAPAGAGASGGGGMGGEGQQQQQEVLLLEQLIKALDRNPDTDLSGSQVVIGSGGGGYGIDSQGRVWLPQGDDLSAWGDWLAGVDTSVVLRRRARARERRAKERAAARGMEVEMVFTDAGTAGLLVYEGFLEHVIGHAEEHGAVCDGRLFELPVRVLGQAVGRIGGGGGGGGEGGGGEGGGGGDWLVDGGRLPTWSGDRASAALRPGDFTIDRRFGYAAVPVTATPTQVYTFLSQAGGDAMAIRRLARDEEQRLERLRTDVRQRLRLRRLVVDEGRITRDQGASGLLRLLRFAPQLVQLTEGLSLCVSDAHRLPMPQEVYDEWDLSPLGLGGAGSRAGRGNRASGGGGAGGGVAGAGAGGSAGVRRGGSGGEQEWESGSVPFVHVKWNFSVSEL
ncbi:unnamed protein product [Closterium sp. NIES-65]|nr:unnamed protein product [Closterium sp. NIES-65]